MAMPPRALTEQEKDLQQQRICKSAKELVLLYGVKKVSVDDIIRAAGVGKATFYGYFASKEALLLQLVWDIYQGFVGQTREMILGSTPDTLRQNVAAFLHSLIRDREKVFFFQNHQELSDLIAAAPPSELRDFSQMEYRAFEGLIALAGLDTAAVKPDVVHNYVHSMYFSASDGSMMPAHLEETIDAMMNGLLSYLFAAGS